MSKVVTRHWPLWSCAARSSPRTRMPRRLGGGRSIGAQRNVHRSAGSRRRRRAGAAGGATQQARRRPQPAADRQPLDADARRPRARRPARLPLRRQRPGGHPAPRCCSASSRSLAVPRCSRAARQERRSRMQYAGMQRDGRRAAAGASSPARRRSRAARFPPASTPPASCARAKMNFVKLQAGERRRASSTRSASSPPTRCSRSCARTSSARRRPADRHRVARRRPARVRHRGRAALGERALLRHGARGAGRRRRRPSPRCGTS